jgi:hypothetical protein
MYGRIELAISGRVFIEIRTIPGTGAYRRVDDELSLVVLEIRSMRMGLTNVIEEQHVWLGSGSGSIDEPGLAIGRCQCHIRNIN